MTWGAHYRHRLVYRHLNGEVEGFAGMGTKPENAADMALRKIRNQVGDTFDESRVVALDSLTPAELAKVRADWTVSARSSVT